VALLAVAFLAGCTSVPLPPSDGGWRPVPGTDGVTFTGRLVGCGDTCTFEAAVRNEGSTAYRLHDDCAGHWFDWDVRDAAGALMTPTSEAVCAMCSSGAPFAPGAERTREWAWDRIDDRTRGWSEEGGHDPGDRAPPGRYVATLRVTVDAGDGTPCGGGPFFQSAPLNVTFVL
jgi:hypothetical protein